MKVRFDFNAVQTVAMWAFFIGLIVGAKIG